MPAFVELKLTDKLACQGSVTTYGVLRPEDLIAAGDIQAVDDQESLTFSFGKSDATGAARAITARMRAGRVVTVVWSDGTFDEWKVREVTQGRGLSGVVSVVCSSLWLDLVERANGGVGWVSDASTPLRNYEYTLTFRTPSNIWTYYVIPNCPSWVGSGTINPTTTIPSLPVSRLTPGALALAVRDYLRGIDVGCDVRLRRNGTTNYLLDLVTQVGASANTPVFHPSVALTTLKERTDVATQATRVLVKGATDPTGLPGILGRARWVVGTPSGNTLPLTDPNGGSSPVAFDNQWVNGYLLRVKTGATFPITSSSASGGSVTCSGGISTIAAGEYVEFRLTEPLTNTRTTTTRYAVSAVPDGTHITCGVSVPITVDNQYVDWYARVWTLAAGGAIVITTRITGTVAATDVLTVLSSAGVNNTHYVEFIQLDGNGEIPGYVDHPTCIQADPTGYGVKVGEITRKSFGVTNLVPNSWMSTWPSSVAMPTGWRNTGASTFGSGLSQNTNASFVRYGTLSLRFQGEVGKTLGLQTPTIYPNIAAGMTNVVSVRVWVYFTWLTTPAAVNAIVQLRTLDPSGAPTGAALASVQLSAGPPNYLAPVAVALNTWVAVELVAYNLAATDAPYGLAVTFAGNGESINLSGYLDTIEAYQSSTNSTTVFEHGDATVLTQNGNSFLRTNAAPPAFYEFGVLDLERAFPADFPRLALTLGGNVRAADVEGGTDVTVRLLRRERDLLTPHNTRLMLANMPVLQSTILSVTKATTLTMATTDTPSRIGSSTSSGTYINAAAASTVNTVAGANVLLANGVYVAVAVSSAATVSGTSITAPSVKVVLPGALLTSP